MVPQEVFIPRIRARFSRVQPPAPAEAPAAEALSVETSVKADLTEKLPEAEANAENNGDSPLYPWGARFNPDYEEEEMAPERSGVVIESSGIGHHTSDTISISSPLMLKLSSPRDGDGTARQLFNNKLFRNLKALEILWDEESLLLFSVAPRIG